MEQKQRILVVDDEETLCEALRFNLEEEGYSVDVVFSAEEALALNLTDYSLILLDIMMEEMSGTTLASILKRRQDTSRIPIIFCTAKDNEDDMVNGLNIGVDDYITKPYSIRNVIARIRAVLRRCSQPVSTGQSDIIYKGIHISTIEKNCSIDGKDIRMPRKEFELLVLMLSNPGRVFSREELLKKIWPEEVVVLDRVIDVNITRLRSKLGVYGKNIVTRSGYGYGFFK